MTNSIARRFRPRFTVRTLAIFVALLSMYFGAWEATKAFGVPKVPFNVSGQDAVIVDAWSTIPLVICCDMQCNQSHVSDKGDRYIVRTYTRRNYYLWLFGPKIRLPFEPW